MSTARDFKLKAIESFKPDKKSKEDRQSNRIDIRENEKVIAEYKNEKLRVFDISSSGICLILKNETADEIEKDKQVEIKISIGSEKSFTRIYYICWKSVVDENTVKVGMKAIDMDKAANVALSEDLLIQLPVRFPIIGYLYKSFFYKEKSLLRIDAISSKYAEITVFDSDMIVYVGMDLEILLSIQSRSKDILFCKIKKIRANEQGKLSFLVEIDEISKSNERDIVNHLLNDQNISPQIIRDAGFEVRNIANYFKFRAVKTHDEYVDVLKLRFQSYKAAGKTKEGTSYLDMRAPLDYISRVVAVYHGDKLVASVALSFPDEEEMILDTERALDGGYNKTIPSKKDMMEISRLCTHVNYRKGDLLVRMFEYMFYVLATSGRSYAISSCDDNLWSVYRKIGWKKTGQSYAHPFLNGLTHHVILISVKAGLTSFRVNPLVWMKIYAPMCEHMLKNVNLKLNFFEKIVLSAVVKFRNLLMAEKKY